MNTADCSLRAYNHDSDQDIKKYCSAVQTILTSIKDNLHINDYSKLETKIKAIKNDNNEIANSTLSSNDKHLEVCKKINKLNSQIS